MDFPRLHDSIEWSIQKLEKPRKNRHDAVKLLAGFHYGERAASRRQPTNFLELATSIYTYLLAPHAPSSVVHTDIPGLKPMAADMEAAFLLLAWFLVDRRHGKTTSRTLSSADLPPVKADPS